MDLSCSPQQLIAQMRASERNVRRELDLQQQKTQWERDRQDLLAGQLRQHVQHTHQMTMQLNENILGANNRMIESSDLREQCNELQGEVRRLRGALKEVCSAYAPHLLD